MITLYENTKKVVSKATFFALLLLSFVFAFSANAASFQVSPVRANLSAVEKTSVFEFYNTADEEVSVQVDVKKWMQENGQEKFEKTRDLVAVPAIFKMQAGKKQVVRIALLKPQASDVEEAYRLFFTELPGPQKKENTNVKMRLRISVPVFIKPTEITLAPQLVLSNFDSVEKTITVNNPSNQHVQILEFLLNTTEGVEIKSSAGAYLLPKQANTFKLNIPPGAVIQSIVADTDTAGKVIHDVLATP